SAFFACVAAGLLSVDGEHFVHSRTSLLDIVLMAFVLLAFYFVLLDREQVTKRLASWSKRTSTTSEPTPAEATARTTPTAQATASPAASAADASASARVRERRRRRDEMNFGPRLGVRPWIIAAGISVGLAMGVKWSGLYAAAAFGILLVAWDVHSRYRAGVVHPWLGMFIRDSIPSFLKLVPVAFVSYLACWA